MMSWKWVISFGKKFRWEPTKSDSGECKLDFTRLEANFGNKGGGRGIEGV